MKEVLHKAGGSLPTSTHGRNMETATRVSGAGSSISKSAILISLIVTDRVGLRNLYLSVFRFDGVHGCPNQGGT